MEIGGGEVFPPTSNCPEQGRVYFFNDNISVENDCCESICGSAILYTDTSGFELFDDMMCLVDSDCSSIEGEYSQLHTFVYFDSANPTHYNPYTYQITNNGDDLALVVTNGIGDKAYYNNVLLNSPEYKEPQISIYPNPVINRVFIETQEIIKRLQMNDINGKEVMMVNENTGSIDVSKLETGIYFLVMTTQNSKSIKRIVKK